MVARPARRWTVLLLGACSLFGCARVRSSVRPLGRLGRAHHGEVAVFYAIAPRASLRALAEVRVSAQDERAHLDVVLEEALGRVREVGGDTLVIRELSTSTRLVSGALMRTCGRFDGPISGMPGMSCQPPTQALEVELTLVGTAMRRTRATAPADSPWGLPPPLGAMPQSESSDGGTAPSEPDLSVEEP